jgi:hypothetical protein
MVILHSDFIASHFDSPKSLIVMTVRVLAVSAILLLVSCYALYPYAIESKWKIPFSPANSNHS